MNSNVLFVILQTEPIRNLTLILVLVRADLLGMELLVFAPKEIFTLTL